MSFHPDIHIDRNSSIPLYVQVESLLRRLIAEGSFENDKQPITEKFLQEQLGVSRNTVRQAVARLCDQGLLTRERSRGIILVPGSFQIIGETVNGLSFTEAAIKKGQTPSAKLLHFECLEPPEEIALALHMKKNEQAFYSRRLRFIDDSPVSITNSYVPTQVAPTMSADDFSEHGPNQSIYYILERTYNFEILMWVENLEAVSIIGEEAKLLKIEEGLPGIFRKDVIFSKNQGIIAHNDSIMTHKYQIRGVVCKRERSEIWK